MSSRIYVVTHTKLDHLNPRFVRAQTSAGAVRAVVKDLFSVAAASTDEIVEASQRGHLDILDALAEPEDAADPGPVPPTAIGPSDGEIVDLHGHARKQRA
jgi:hypothetical protein